jgi:hypothetical protein
MRLPRPYIPIGICVSVAARQCLLLPSKPSRQAASIILRSELPASEKLKRLLLILFGDETAHLDHDPALQNREKIYRTDYDGRGGVLVRTIIGYRPDANDPEFLRYRDKQEHKIKTLVRGDGAQYSDAALARKNKRIAKSRDARREEYVWPRRKIQNRKTAWPKTKSGES